MGSCGASLEYGAAGLLILSMRIIELVCLLLAASVSNAQVQHTVSAIEWSPERMLKVSDFKVVQKGAPVPEKLGVNQAVTRTGFLYALTHINSGREKGRNRLKVQALMYPGNSYIRAAVLNSGAAAITYLLNHEQKHFDISEIFAREASRFLQTHAFSNKSYGTAITNEMQRLSKEAAALQTRYDKETNNGRNPLKQQQWNAYIAKRLSSLSAYSQKEFFIDVQ